jgi:7-cyano-7-deazaguanine synthase
MKKPRPTRLVTVLLSGGIDSTACVEFYLAQQAKVTALNIDYGQPSARREQVAASKIAKHYQVPLKKLTISGLKPLESGYIIGRNAALLAAALLASKSLPSVMAMGIHSGTNYSDCSSHFVAIMQAVFDLYADGKTIVAAPFLQWSKLDIWNYVLMKKIPFEITYSCELGKQQPCGSCLSCSTLETLYAS